MSTNAYDYESITVADTAIGFTAAKLKPSSTDTPKAAICTLETGQIRFRTDGSDPTSAEGHLLKIGQQLIVESFDSMKGFRAIRTGATSGVLKVTYET
ncbi:MAG: hypothetical protein V3U75_01245 [Methylococcaceae bacterium]